MVHIVVNRGLDIPMEGAPDGAVRDTKTPKFLALDLAAFPDTAFTLLVKTGDQVQIGTPLAADKQRPDRLFVSPASGTVSNIIRGEKRKLHSIVIHREEKEESVVFEPLSPNQAPLDAIRSRMLESGLFTLIYTRPFSRLANPNKAPRSIFVKALESAPFTPSAEMQVDGHEEDFAEGLRALKRFTEGSVHLVYREGSSCKAFTEAKDVQTHTVSGPHPAANPSLHIQKIDPITSAEDIVWVVRALDVVRIGHLLKKGSFLTTRIVGLGGSACQKEHRGFYRVRDGISLADLFDGGALSQEKQWISGDPLMGESRGHEGYLGYFHTAAGLILEQQSRTPLHFFRLGKNRYTASRTYLSGHTRDPDKRYPFTTAMHGEPRALITNMPYDKVMPLEVPTLPLIRALMAEDYELADQLGLLEVDSEDFALPTFVCPSKVEMVEIVRKAQREYAIQVLPET